MLEFMAGELLAMWPDYMTREHMAREQARSAKLPHVRGSVAIIPIHGVIAQRSSDLWFGGTSTMQFEATLSRALNNPQVGAVVLDIDSPGGTTAGVQMAGDRVYAARGVKPIIAVANSMAASAAYWIGSAAQSFIAVPGAWAIGSIGVFRVHEDHSQKLAKQGVKVTLIASPERKTEANPFEPLSADAEQFAREQVEETYSQFAGDVARNRGVTPQIVRSDYGVGRTFHAETAKRLGMVDRIATVEDVLRDLGGGSTNQSASAELVAAWNGGGERRPDHKLRRDLLEKKLHAN